VIRSEGAIPAPILAGPVTVDIVIDRVGTVDSGSVMIAVDGLNLTLDDLVEDINAALVLNGFEDISARSTRAGWS
jgi:hypothetical protein